MIVNAGEKKIRISIIMPVRNEAKHIERTIRNILEQDYPPDFFEILVIDGQSTDGTPEIIKGLKKEYPNIRLYSNAKKLSSAARNIGIRNASGEIVLVVDGHCKIPYSGMLLSVEKLFQNPDIFCLGRPQPLLGGSELLQKTIAAARDSWFGHSTQSRIYSQGEGPVDPVSVGCAYRKKIFEIIGGFDETFDACEDVELNYRIKKAGLNSFFSRNLEIEYIPRETLSGLWRQLARYGSGRFDFIKKHPEAINAEVFIPPLFVLGIFSLILSFFVSPVLFYIVAAPYFLYGTVLIFESLRLTLKSRNAKSYLLPVIFFIIHFSLGFGFLRSFWRFFQNRNIK
jgi:succinoglycan biosynthesis protein ExoA